jgi:hypothetical protein
MANISDEQLKLVNEIYTREGETAVLKYLTEHEKMSVSEAKAWLKSLGFKDDTCMACYPEEKAERTEWEHYCMFDNEIFIGGEGALCPKCGTDGCNSKSGIVTKIRSYFRKLIGQESQPVL